MAYDNEYKNSIWLALFPQVLDSYNLYKFMYFRRIKYQVINDRAKCSGKIEDGSSCNPTEKDSPMSNLALIADQSVQLTKSKTVRTGIAEPVADIKETKAKQQEALKLTVYEKISGQECLTKLFYIFDLIVVELQEVETPFGS
ncbi:hypothetical protein RND71_022454 [Anisodus tanguticus]|uniref:Uncharacterized protein n=1 Tax=Anisodus tanguticus TaxID=243964 RepID=A0AAE1VCY4_9SOLA|nr:hypothetical protein RND71_022454 [Anisodus tanguticus]